MTAEIQVRVLASDECDVLQNVAPDVFDEPVLDQWAREFFQDPRHHLVVALDGSLVVGMASGVHYVHPDKQPDFLDRKTHV